jgi:hypothetical protein
MASETGILKTELVARAKHDLAAKYHVTIAGLHPFRIATIKRDCAKKIETVLHQHVFGRSCVWFEVKKQLEKMSACFRFLLLFVFLALGTAFQLCIA